MFKKMVTMAFGVLAAVGLMFAFFGSQTQAQESVDNFVFINYIGQELFLDLDDVTYTVPGTDTVPDGGRLTLQLNPGEYKFAANVPGVIGKAGEFTLSPGGFIAKAARLDQTAPAIGPDGILLAKPKDIVDVFDFDPNVEPAADTPPVDTWQPAVAAAGQGSIVWINYIGDELTVDLNGELFKVAPSAGDISGRLQIDVAPGDYTYTASVPGGSLNGPLNVAAGQVTGLSFTGVREERKYDVGEKYDFLLPVTMTVAQEDLTAQATAVIEPAAPVDTSSPAPAEDAAPAEPVVNDAAAVEPGLLVKNYAGEALTFTIDGREYTIPNNDELTIDLPAGSYSFTASRPYVATTGTVELLPDQGVELSVAVNVAGDVLSV
ncbi:MAG: hypothetical protein KDI62_18865, partial [Anaerolineae bacterium]|nr:hypothetical protein [Anaerolineae bacterium]